MTITSKFRNVAVMTAVAVGAAGVFFVLREHWWHALRFAPYSIYLLFLACPLMHLFMHHGHGGHGAHEHGEAPAPPSDNRSPGATKG